MRELIMSEQVNYDPFSGGDILSSHETTEAQKELWLAAQMGHDANCSYNLTVRLDFEIALEARKFRQALEKTAARHDSLRMTFSKDGAFFHIATVPKNDFDEITQVDDGVIERLLKSEAETPFDLAVGPLWRCKFINRANGCTILLTTHHIAADGWSTGIVLQSLAEEYVGVLDTEESIAKQFGDYARWLDSESVRAQTDDDLAYWQSKFSTHSMSPSIPSRNERINMHDFQCRFLSHRLSEDCFGQIKDYAKAQKVTLSNLLTTAFAVYLSNLSGSTEVVLGIPTAGQLDSGMTDLVAHCVNTLPFKVSVNCTDTFADVLAKSKSDMLDDFEHRRITFGTLLKSSLMLRERLDGPLVPILFNVESAEFKLSFGDIQPEISFIPRKFDYFDASFNCAVTDMDLCIEVHFSAALYNDEDMQFRLIEFERFLTNVASRRHDSDVASIPFLADAHHEAMARFNATESEFGEFVSLPQLVAKHAMANPDRVAFIYRSESISYQELDKRSDTVAAALVAHGVENGDLVAIAVPRSIEMVLSLLGVLKTGACYMPIDSDLPPNRIDFMLENAGAKAIIFGKAVGKYSQRPGVKSLIVEEMLTDNSPDLKSIAIQQEQIAYVIYTSGSTGEPKGVEVSHGSLWNFLNGMQSRPGFTESDRFIALTTLSFDIAVLELWLPVLLGASSVIVDKRDSQDGRVISNIIESQGVSVIQATPSSWNLLLASKWQGSKEIKAIAGGEPLQPELIEQLLPKVGKLWNAYGPTEATVWVLFKRIDNELKEVPVGSPIPNSKVHIIGETGCLVPPGIVGEICISGNCLARGYLGQPKLTNEKFRFHGELDSIVYHTGDLGYFNATEGDLYCLGRVDDQVKLRGYRIELDEISSVFAKIFSVDQAIALIIKDNTNEYIALVYHEGKGREINDTEARAALQEYLPDYMVPSRYYGIESFPITPNGKIDKPATIKLIGQPQKSASQEDTRRNNDDQISEIQKLVIDVMKEALRVPTLSLQDNFFDAGGHSLLAMKTVMQLGALLDIEIDLVLIFDYPAIVEFSDKVESLLIAELSASEQYIS